MSASHGLGRRGTVIKGTRVLGIARGTDETFIYHWREYQDSNCCLNWGGTRTSTTTREDTRNSATTMGVSRNLAIARRVHRKEKEHNKIEILVREYMMKREPHIAK